MNGAVTLGELCMHLSGGTADEYLLLRRALGRGERWLRAPTGAWRRAGLSRVRAERLAGLRDGRRARAERAAVAAAGARLVAHRQAAYPAGLRTLHRPPLLLAVSGRWPPPEAALAVVGCRAASAYGRGATRDLVAAATDAGLAIVSGLARGIDRYALEACLDADGWPVAVLGCGLDVVYPPEHRQLQARIAAEGSLVSEFPMGQHPERFAFPRRNRVIAALARAVLVVEAGQRSGALITAGHALELGRDVLAVPGPIDASQSRGTNRLIYDGAIPALDARALLQAVACRALSAGRDATLLPADPVLQALERRPRPADEIALLLGLEVGTLRSRLIALELRGEVRRLPGGLFERRR